MFFFAEGGTYAKIAYIVKTILCADLEEEKIFVNSEILGIQIWWGKKNVNYDKFEIVTKQSKSNILPTWILFVPFDRCYMILP